MTTCDYANLFACSSCPEPQESITVINTTLTLDGITALQVNQQVYKIAGSDNIYQLPATPINAAAVNGFLNSGQQRTATVANTDDFYINNDLMIWNYDLADTDVVWVSYLSTTGGTTVGSLMPVGSTMSYPAALAVPDGWLLCDTNVLIASYLALYSKIGLSFCDGSEAAGEFRTPVNDSLDASMVKIVKA